MVAYGMPSVATAQFGRDIVRGNPDDVPMFMSIECFLAEHTYYAIFSENPPFRECRELGGLEGRFQEGPLSNAKLCQVGIYPRIFMYTSMGVHSAEC
jgi:hypothetical protein